MLEPNVAQSFALTVAAANSAPPADAGPAAGAVSGYPEDDLPFAAVLRRQLGQSDDAKTAKIVESLVDARVKTEASPGDKTDATDPQADLLAWLAPLMAGIAVPPSPPAATGGPDGETVSADPASALPVPIALPVLPGSTPAPVLPGSAAAPVLPGSAAAPVLPGSTPAPVLPADPASTLPVALPVPIALPVLPGSTPAPALPADGAMEAALPGSSPQAAGVMLSQRPDLAVSGGEGRGSDPSAQVAGLAAEASEQSSAILAGAESTAAESAGKTGNGSAASGPVQVGFDTVLNAAHGASAAAARMHQPAAHSTEAKPITTPVGAHGWDAEIGDKLAWMVGRHETRAELVLNPPQMGRIEVSLSINGNQANALFVSANPAVREALENAVPQLRESLQGAGIALGQAQVGAESFRQPSAQRREKDDNSARGEDRGIGSATASSAAEPALRRGNGLIDTFA